MNNVDTMWVLYMGWRSHVVALGAYKEKPTIEEIVQYISNQYSMYDYDEYKNRIERIYQGEKVSFDRFGPDGIDSAEDFYWLEERRLS